jgi:hypothetical protein
MMIFQICEWCASTGRRRAKILPAGVAQRLSSQISVNEENLSDASVNSKFTFNLLSNIVHYDDIPDL